MVPNVGVDPRRGTPLINGSVPRVGNRSLFFWHVQQISAHTGEEPETILRELARERRELAAQADMANSWNNQIQGANWDAKQKGTK